MDPVFYFTRNTSKKLDLKSAPKICIIFDVLKNGNRTLSTVNGMLAFWQYCFWLILDPSMVNDTLLSVTYFYRISATNQLRYGNQKAWRDILSKYYITWKSSERNLRLDITLLKMKNYHYYFNQFKLNRLYNTLIYIVTLPPINGVWKMGWEHITY